MSKNTKRRAQGRKKNGQGRKKRTRRKTVALFILQQATTPAMKFPALLLVVIITLLVVSTYSSVVLEDHPLQIIRPDASHTNLLIDEENIKIIEAIEDNIAVVGVVGPFHSGKSFLLNQLMSKPAGFKVGPTVAAETMGLWVWGKPLQVTDSETGEPLSIIFLELRFMEAEDDGAITSSYPDIIKFPPLMWVVEDFFQDLQGKTATQWIHSLLEARPRDAKMASQASLQSLFPSIEAHTLFLPSVLKSKLQNLDGIRDEELHPDYKDGVAELRTKVMEAVSPKVQGANSLSGKELAALLRLLVQAANTGTFPDVPSVWGAFLEQELLGAQDDTIKLFNQESKRFMKDPVDVATVLTPQELDTLQTTSQARAEDLFKKLLFGLKEVYTPGIQKLREKIREIKATQIRDNTRRIEELCENVRNVKATDHQLEMDKIKLPVPSKQLRSLHSQSATSLMQSFDDVLVKFKDTPVFSKQRAELENKITASLSKYTLANAEKLKAILQDAVDKASSHYKHKTTEVTNPLTYDEFMAIHKSTSEAATVVFEEAAKAAKSEPEYAPYFSHFKQAIDDLRTEFNAKNDKRIEVIISETRVQCSQAFNKDMRKVDLPMDEAELSHILKTAQKGALDTFKNSLSKFAKFDKFKTELSLFEGMLDKKVGEYIETNIKETKDSCVGPFVSARQRISEEAKDYFWRYSLERRAREIAEEELARSGKIKSNAFRSKIIDRWMAEDIPDVIGSTSTFAFWQTVGVILAFLVIVGGYILTTLLTTKKSPSVSGLRRGRS